MALYDGAVSLAWADTSSGFVFGAEADGAPTEVEGSSEADSFRSSAPWEHVYVSATDEPELVVVGLARNGVSETELRRSVTKMARGL